jgi:uroporphyrin-III C-methyltransferase
MRTGGTVYLVGAGPGDPGLVTLRAARLLRRADIVVHDALVDVRVLRMAPAHAQCIDVGKRAGGRHFPQAAIHRVLIAAAQRHAVVVRLKGGDPFIFGRGGEEARALEAAGVRCRIVPGVTAALGAAACAGIPLTYRGIAPSVTFVTGHAAPDSAIAVDWAALAHAGGTLAVYMALENLRAISAQLIAAGLAAATPAAVIASATLPGQCMVAGTLVDIADRAETAAIATPAIVLIGATVAMGQTTALQRAAAACAR